jgi:transposase
MESRQELFPEFEPEEESESKGSNRAGRKVVFKVGHRSQQYLLPPSLDEFVPAEHVARFIDAAVDRLDLSELLARYKGGGASAFHPAVLLKIWIFGWVRKIYTSRPLARACTRDVEFMWIAASQTPSFMTLSEFRKGLSTEIKGIFKGVVKLAVRAGIIDGSEVYIDHTKMQANANPHRVTYRKNLDRYLAKVDVELEKLLQVIDRLNEEEEMQPLSEQEDKPTPITPAMLDELVAHINQELKEGRKDRAQGKEEKDQLRKGKEQLKKQARYQAALKDMGELRSMAKADPEAPVMKMKDGISFKPAYNVGIATQNGIVTGYEVSDNSNDATSFKAVLANVESNLGGRPKRACADAAYGNLENYRHLDEQGIEGYVKYPGWDRDLKGKRSRFEAESFGYNPGADCWICPSGKPLRFVQVETKTNKRTGFAEHIRQYRAESADCLACSFKAQCTQGESRSIAVNQDVRKARKRALHNLASAMGIRMRSLRSVEVETIFANLKHASGFTRFNMRGKQGVSIETGLFLIANDLRRMHQAFVRYLRYGALPVRQLS